MTIRPSQLENWDDIDQSKANIQSTGGKPELYGWFKIGEVWYAHRKPTIEESHNNEFK